MNDFSPWSEKHKPSELAEMVGQASTINDAKEFVENFKKEKKKALFLHGPPGNGKTTLAYALASELDYELVEMNASDFRTEKGVQGKIGHAVRQQSLLQKKGKIILIDEIDGIYGTVDRGGLKAIYDVIAGSAYPIILTANDPWNTKFSTLRRKCKVVKMRKVDIRSSLKRLKQIAEKENLKAEEGALHELARRSEGDLRAAINDLQSIGEGSESISLKDLDNLTSREKQVQVFETLLAIFKSKNKEMIMQKFRNSDKTPNEIFQWLAENIPKEYEKREEVAKAYDALSRSDVFRGRIVHTQAWTLQSYANEIMVLGTALAKREKYHKFTKYMPPSILIKMGRSKMARALRDRTAGKIGKKLHCSRKRVIEQLPFLALMMLTTTFKLPMTATGQ